VIFQSFSFCLNIHNNDNNPIPLHQIQIDNRSTSSKPITLTCSGKATFQCNFNNVNLNDSNMEVQLEFPGKNSSYINIIVFENSNMSFIPNEIYENITRLKTIQLKNVNIGTLNSDFFMDRQSLTAIHIIQSNIKKIFENAFEGLTNLRTLYIYNNPYIGQIQENPFKGLKSMIFIFSGNKIDNIDATILHFLMEQRKNSTISQLSIKNITGEVGILKPLFNTLDASELSNLFTNWNEISEILCIDDSTVKNNDINAINELIKAGNGTESDMGTQLLTILTPIILIALLASSTTYIFIVIILFLDKKSNN
jgi:hypothetical protein